VAVALSDRTTFQRALQGWLDVHSFVLREGVEELRLAEGTAGIPGTSDPDVPPVGLERLLGIGESGLGLLIDVNGNGPSSFMRNSAEVLAANVDHRLAKLVQACGRDSDCNNGDGLRTMTCESGACRIRGFREVPQHEQPIGVPTKILETSVSYLKTLQAYLARTARLTYGQPADTSPSGSRQAALARFGTGMRLVLWAEQLAVGINEKVGCSADFNTCLAIRDRFAAVRDEMNVVRVRVTAEAESIRTGRNPFNIPEDDVPLFFGDPAGTNSRYFASSDYLINGWAIPAVAQAQSYLDAARTSWLGQLQAKVQDQLNQHNRAQEREQLMSKYGSVILGNCGNLQVPGAKGPRFLDSTEVIPYFADTGLDLDSSTCFIEPMCLGDEGLDGRIALRSTLANAYLDEQGAFITTRPQLGEDATVFVRSEMCRISYMNDTWSWNKFVTLMKEYCPADDFWNPPAQTSENFQYCRAVKLDDGNMYIRRSNGMGYIPVAALYGPIKRSEIGDLNFYRHAIDGPGPDDNIYFFDEIRAHTEPNRLKKTYAEIWAEMATPACSARLQGDYPRPDRRDLPGACYKGALGVAFKQVESNRLRIRRAKEVLDGGQKGLRDQMVLCSSIDMNNSNLAYLTLHYNEMVDVYQIVSGFAGSVDKGVQTGLAAKNPYAGIFAGVANFGLSIFGNAVEDEARELAQMESRFGREEKAQECWNSFRAQRRALATAMTDVKIAATDMEAQAAQFRNLSSQNSLSLQEGKAVLQREKDSPLSSLAHHYWVNEKVEQFSKEFEWARRLAFLAMRSVEFEFQQSLPFRSQIVAATTPAQLQDVMIGLQQEQSSRTINRRRPEEASVVVSLRDDVLAIADRSDDPVGERDWTPAQRFMSRLWDDRYAVRDSAGQYLGQGVPFTLGPSGILETRCGERVWRATATLQGDGIESSAPGASVLLLKRNTFSSQYCNGKSPPQTTDTGATIPGPKMQVGVVHTSAQLFRPGANVDLSDAEQFTAAQLFPWFNVRRTDLYKTSFRDGASEELAGRGLYGDYVLLFPKQVLEDGFALEKVEDVLLRLDYLSVDNLSQ
jgi:hypothetical protein